MIYGPLEVQGSVRTPYAQRLYNVAYHKTDRVAGRFLYAIPIPPHFYISPLSPSYSPNYSLLLGHPSPKCGRPMSTAQVSPATESLSSLSSLLCVVLLVEAVLHHLQVVLQVPHLTQQVDPLLKAIKKW